LWVLFEFDFKFFVFLGFTMPMWLHCVRFCSMMETTGGIVVAGPQQQESTHITGRMMFDFVLLP
jgi:hypothetical protein